MVAELDGNTFESFVKSNGIAVVDCWAPWCGPCRRMGPIVDEAAADLEGRAAVAKLNTDENGAIAEKYRIDAIPTLLFFKNGEIAETLVGLRPKEDIIAIVDRL